MPVAQVSLLAFWGDVPRESSNEVGLLDHERTVGQLAGLRGAGCQRLSSRGLSSPDADRVSLGRAPDARGSVSPISSGSGVGCVPSAGTGIGRGLSASRE